MFADAALKRCFATSYHGVHFWTAGHRVGSSEKFEWRLKDSSQLLSFSNWKVGEPSSAYERCIHLLDGFGYKWNDRGCGVKTCFVCEIPQ